MNIQDVIQGLEDTTLQWSDLTGKELFLLSNTKLVKPAAAEARRRILAKGLQRTPYGWCSRQDIADLGIVLRDGQWTNATRERLINWGLKKRRERDSAVSARNEAIQATLRVGA